MSKAWHLRGRGAHRNSPRGAEAVARRAPSEPKRRLSWRSARFRRARRAVAKDLAVYLGVSERRCRSAGPAARCAARARGHFHRSLAADPTTPCFAQESREKGGADCRTWEARMGSPDRIEVDAGESAELLRAKRPVRGHEFHNWDL
eukprot:scaffold7639_cov258-Pinguiococcus_pyrenoidosus.AAC.1